MHDDSTADLLKPRRLWSRAEVLERDCPVLRVPAYWDQQFWHQVALVPADADGYRAMAAVEALGHSIPDMFRREERNLSHITAVALLRTMHMAVHPTPFTGTTLAARIHCTSDQRGLLDTCVEAA